MGNPVGYRFHPTDEELISFYLYNMIVGNVCLVDEAISEVNICKFDPWDLCSRSRIKSEDPVWYFFSARDSKYMNSKRTNRTTESGYWKATGVDRKIKAKRGDRRVIGTKKTLVFYSGRVPNGKRTPWVMHEYHATSLPVDKRTHVVCKIKYKGEDAGIPSGSSSELSHSQASNSNHVGATNTASEVDQPVQETSGSFNGLSEHDLTGPLSEQAGLSLWEVQSPHKFNGNVNGQQQTLPWSQDDEEFLNELKHVDRKDVESLFTEGEQVSYLSMQENCNDYRPQKSLTGVYVDYSSDSDAESISATSHQETLSPVDSVDSLNGHYQPRTDAFHVDEILSLGTDDHKLSTTTSESPIRIKSWKSQTQPENVNVEAQKRPIQLQLQSKHHSVRPPKEEVKEGAEPIEAGGPSKNKSSCAEEAKRERKMVQDTNKKTYTVNTKNWGWFIFQDTTEKSHKNPPYIYLMNMIIGFSLFVAMVAEIILVH